MLSQHCQDAFSHVLPPLPTALPGNSVLRCIATMTAVGLFIVWYWLLLVLLGVIHFASLSSILVFLHRCRRAALFSLSLIYLYHFSAALVLSCSLGRKCSCIWQVLEVGFRGFSHFGKKGAKECKACRSRKRFKASNYVFARYRAVHTAEITRRLKVCRRENLI